VLRFSSYQYPIPQLEDTRVLVTISR
jgi:hypothetical protein